MATIRDQLQDVFQTVFDDDEIVLTDDLTADDIMGWDSLQHINLIIAIEKRFGVKFAAAEIAATKQAGQNVGTLIQMLDRKGVRPEAGPQ